MPCTKYRIQPQKFSVVLVVPNIFIKTIKKTLIFNLNLEGFFVGCTCTKWEYYVDKAKHQDQIISVNFFEKKKAFWWAALLCDDNEFLIRNARACECFVNTFLQVEKYPHAFCTRPFSSKADWQAFKLGSRATNLRMAWGAIWVGPSSLIQLPVFVHSKLEKNSLQGWNIR